MFMYKPLNEDELAALWLVIKGYTGKEIAEELNRDFPLTPRQAETRVESAKRKLDADQRSEAVAKAIAARIIPVEEVAAYFDIAAWDVSQWRSTIAEAKCFHYRGAAKESTVRLGPLLNVMYCVIEGSKGVWTQDQLQEALRLWSEGWLGLAADCNVSLTRVALKEQSCHYQQHARVLRRLIRDPNVQANLDYAEAEIEVPSIGV